MNQSGLTYEDFIAAKRTQARPSGFDVLPDDLHPQMFDFQRFVVAWALGLGRAAIFAGTGLGKTIMQLVWADVIAEKTGGKVLILAPLAVTGQTIAEGRKFGIEVVHFTKDGRTDIANYDSLHKIDVSEYAGIVLDESSILKNFTGETRRALTEAFKNTPYRLCCTATPSPNDINELGNHSEFLGILDAPDMRSRWFVRDEGMNNYRLKGHAKKDFYAWVASWAKMFSKPSDIGFDDSAFVLPELRYIEHTIQTDSRGNGKLFNDVAVNATNFNRELRLTMLSRLEKAAEIVNASSDPFIVWVNQNGEEEQICKMIPGAVPVRGNMSPEEKERRLLGFANGDFRVLVTKKRIAAFGLNYQHCHNQVFASVDFSFEMLFQAVRRSWRFRQEHPVNIYIITTDTMQNVVNALADKQRQFDELLTEMNNAMNHPEDYGLVSDYTRREERCEYFHLVNGDSVDVCRELESNSVDFIIFSPPFSSLFTYSNNLRDMGNCDSHEEFFAQYRFLLKELYRILRPGRIMACHTKDLAVYKNSSGYSGLYDFTGDHHRRVEESGFRYHSKITIWTDPVLEMQRTKTQRLLYKQVMSDSAATGIGLAEYVTLFRKWDGVESDEYVPITNKNKDNFPLDTWQKWASPVWFDIRRTDVLNATNAKDVGDEKHIAPLQLEVIRRCIALWTNPGETILTPFAGIGSEVYEAVRMNRVGIGIELKQSYYEQAVLNCYAAVAEKNQLALAL